MLNRLFFIMMVAGLIVAGWSSWQMYASTGGVTQDKEKTQEISDNWDETQFAEGYMESNETEEETNPSEKKAAVGTDDSDSEKEYEYEAGDKAGELIIPKLESSYQVYWGTDDETLDRGVGYHDSDFTTPPNGLGHTVLSGHRDTVFRELGELEDGDRLYVKFEGHVYEYQIRKIWITDAEDRTVIVEKDNPTLTLTTCYPFSYLGAAPDRYIIQGELISINED